MQIIFDLDDTIFEETTFLHNNGPKYLKKRYGRDFVLQNANANNLSDSFGLEEHFRGENFSDEKIEEEKKRVNQDFWNKNFVKYTLQKAKPGVKRTIKELYKEGVDITFLSTRGKKSFGEEDFLKKIIRTKIVPGLTKIQLKRSGLKYKQLLLVENIEQKVDFIKRFRPDYVFDDHPEMLEKVSEDTNAYCFEAPHNADYKFKGNVSLVKTFEHDTIYDLVSEKRKLEKELRSKTEIFDSSKAILFADVPKKVKETPKFLNPLFYRKKGTDVFYKLVRGVAKGTFIKKVDPIITGLENIPNDGRPIVFVGNHRSKIDPVITTIALKDPVKYAALLRMFQGKENLFDLSKSKVKNWLSAWFITAMGAVPIARPNDENFMSINEKSFAILAQYLRWNGAVAIFPEGTINRSPETQNLHPLRSYTSFSLAIKNNAWIQPMTIVWFPKNLDIKNKVAIKFDKPFHSNNMSPKEAAELWMDISNKNIEELKELSEKIKEISKQSISNDEKELGIQKTLKKYKNETAQ
ncbi:MAG TPA: 1-acyl-sn-glycerol-3-phosphate acyltransferase [Gallicola sp.]|nr:1-acyl-sn-glycerol-3-phosphate acyltransferase [Gallicola sp.]